ncbi:MAG: Uma2 family endonuclease [Caldilineaceae bacterium]|nr:Uma2 family endonuclease [Caldilineaceae bacterium]
MTVLEIPTGTEQMTVTQFEEILQLPENSDRLLELVNGEIVEKMPTEEHGMIATNVNIALGLFSRETKSGRVGTEVRYQTAEDEQNSRLSDVSFTSARRPVVRRGSVPHYPDLAVEIKSPDDSVRKLREKAEYYLENGVAMVWLIYPEQRMVEVYTPDGDVEILFEGDMIDGGEVLPGFSMPVTEVFDDPLAE